MNKYVLLCVKATQKPNGVKDTLKLWGVKDMLKPVGVKDTAEDLIDKLVYSVAECDCNSVPMIKLNKLNNDPYNLKYWQKDTSLIYYGKLYTSYIHLQYKCVKEK